MMKNKKNTFEKLLSHKIKQLFLANTLKKISSENSVGKQVEKNERILFEIKNAF